MSLIKRIELLEKIFGTDEDFPPEACLIFVEDCSRRTGTEPSPITIFKFNGQEIPREPGELYPAFEIRAIREALNQLPARMPGQPAPVPVLIGNGSLQA